MKSALMAVVIAALMCGLVVGPVTQQSAEAQVYGGVKALGSTGTPPTSGTTTDGGEVILVGHGGGKSGGGGRGGGGRGGGKSFGGHSKTFSGGGHRGGSYAYRGGKSHGYKGHGYKGRSYAYRDGKGHKGKNYSHYN